MKDLEAKLKEADEAGARIKLIATDGVFSMDGIICNLKGVCDLADKYNALVMVCLLYTSVQQMRQVSIS